jgi:hypothetical protein
LLGAASRPVFFAARGPRFRAPETRSMRSIRPSLFALLFAAAPLTAQSVGPDVIVGDLPDVSNYGSASGVYAYSVGTTSCNVGNANLSWVSSTNQHPVIACSLYRVKGGRIEQVGISWLKHGFTALTGSVCNSCNNPGTGSLLGVGCSDPYSSGLNGNYGNLGPRFEVNPFTGYFPYPFTMNPSGSTTTRGRIQVASADVDPALNAGATYFVEGHYVTPDDAAAGNHFNNASYRRVTIANDANRTMTLQDNTVREAHAIAAWRQVDSGVSLRNVDVPGEGRFVVGYRATSLGGGQWRHEYAVQNANSDRAGGAFTAYLPAGVSASNLYFHDVAYHSGDPQGGTDWAATNVAGASVSWACTTPPPSNAANALRWGTLYNFAFDANAAWLPNVEIGLWKPGSPASVATTLCKQPTNSGAPFSGGAGYTSTSVAYDFVDASTGANGPVGDDSGQVVTLPFPFVLYDVPLTQLVVSTNGYVAAPSEPANVYTNTAIPNSGQPNHLIAAYWDDLEVAGGGGAATGWCRTLTTGVAPNRRFVIHWNDAEIYNTSNKLSFQIILDEGTHDVTITQIATSAAATGGGATRGIENATGTAGLQLSYNAGGSAVAGTSVRLNYTPPVWGHSADLSLVGDGSTANPFVWNVVSDPNVPVTLMVDVAPGPIDIVNFGRVEIGLTPVHAGDRGRDRALRRLRPDGGHVVVQRVVVDAAGFADADPAGRDRRLLPSARVVLRRAERLRAPHEPRGLLTAPGFAAERLARRGGPLSDRAAAA